MMDEDWKVLMSFFPSNRRSWVETHALKGFRQDKSAPRTYSEPCG